MCNKPIAIWGTGREAARMYYELEKDGEYVDRFFDNYVQQDTYFLDKPVSKPTAEKVKNYFIYIGCKYYTYRVIANQLEEYGLEEIKDFLWCNLYKKKIVVLHGNCHMDVLRLYLNANKEFTGGGYEIYPNESIQHNTRGFISENILQACELLIQQDIRDENLFGYKLSSKYISSRLRKEAKNIVLPNLLRLGYGFFPLTKENINSEPNKRGCQNMCNMFPRTISVIDDLLLEGMSEDEIIEKINEDSLLSHDEIINNFNGYIEKIRTREENCDVKISQFILKHYHEEKIFYDIGHPTNMVMEEMYRQICNIIGINAELAYPVNYKMDGFEDPILLCVKEALKLQYGDSEIRLSDNCYRLSDCMDLKEYVKEYIWWRNKIILGRELVESCK
ncbi:MAG: hypothetical protein J1E98_05255 [Lachnospiraceae bacterium]|nr:hypothetical protein [Lachnospiraceae bacterium]